MDGKFYEFEEGWGWYGGNEPGPCVKVHESHTYSKDNFLKQFEILDFEEPDENNLDGTLKVVMDAIRDSERRILETMTEAAWRPRYP